MVSGIAWLMETAGILGMHDKMLNIQFSEFNGKRFLTETQY
jgi:hypothetical protein